MNLILIPFFLAAHIATDWPWEFGPKYTFQVQVNSTAIPEEDSHVSIRLNVASKLICQPKGSHVLSCHFRDSKADSFVTNIRDPGVAAVPISQESRQEAYEINQDQFEIRFTLQGLDSLVVNEYVQPRELDMIRVIVDQLNIGALDADYDESFEFMENFTLGECLTTFNVNRNTFVEDYRMDRGYVLEPVFSLREGRVVQIQKIRDLHMCTHKVPYFFGSAETMRPISSVVPTVSASESHIAITTREFLSGTTNVITTSIASEQMVTTLYENISLRLESILPAEEEPPEVKEPEQASIFIGRWLTESPREDDSLMERL